MPHTLTACIGRDKVGPAVTDGSTEGFNDALIKVKMAAADAAGDRGAISYRASLGRFLAGRHPSLECANDVGKRLGDPENPTGAPGLDTSTRQDCGFRLGPNS